MLLNECGARRGALSIFQVNQGMTKDDRGSKSGKMSKERVDKE